MKAIRYKIMVLVQGLDDMEKLKIIYQFIRGIKGS